MKYFTANSNMARENVEEIQGPAEEDATTLIVGICTILLIELGCYKLAHYLGKRYGNFRSSCRYTDIGNGASLNSLELSFHHFKCFIPSIGCYKLFF